MKSFLTCWLARRQLKRDRSELTDRKLTQLEILAQQLTEKRNQKMYDDELIDGVGFADPGGRSALRAATKKNPRIYPCPTCKQPNKLTAIDKQRGYQCDSCAERAERGGN